MRLGAAFWLEAVCAVKAPKWGLGVLRGHGSDALPALGGPMWGECRGCACCAGPWGHLPSGVAPSDLDLWHVLSQGSLAPGFCARPRRQKLLPEAG